MEQLAQHPWSLQTASKSSPYLCQTWIELCSRSSTVAAPNWAGLFSACHSNQPTSTWNTCSLLKFPTGISDFFGYSGSNHTESSFAPSPFSVSQSFVSHQQKWTHCWACFKPLSWKVCTAPLPGAIFLFDYLYSEVSFQYIYPDQISPENILRNGTNIFSQFLMDAPMGWDFFYFASLDFLKRMHTLDPELVLLCPRTKSYCLF